MLWQRVIDSHQHYSQSFHDFVTSRSDKIKVLRKALRGNDRHLALRTVPLLTVAEKKALLPEWVDLARAAHGPYQIAWNVIESLPRQWVLKRIEKQVNAILASDVETDYWMFLQLFSKLDLSLKQKLAQRAACHANSEIRELGENCPEYVRSIAEMNLSVRARNALDDLGISSVQQLIQRRASELLEARNFGITTLNEVREKLRQLGLKLRED